MGLPIAALFIFSFPMNNIAYALPIDIVSKRTCFAPVYHLRNRESLQRTTASNERCLSLLHATNMRSLNDEKDSFRIKRRKMQTIIANILSKGIALRTYINSAVRGRLELNQKTHLPPFIQLMIVLVCYIIHLYIFTQNSLVFPIQIIPNNRGWFQSIGYDSLAGIFSLIIYFYLSFVSRQQFSSSTLLTDAKNQSSAALPPLFEDPSYESLPWTVSMYRLKAHFHPNNLNATLAAHGAFLSHELERVFLSVRRTALFLFIAYRWTGRFAQICESFLYRLAGIGVPMTIAMHRSLVVLLSHLTWVLIGTLILSRGLYPNFFGEDTEKNRERKWIWPWQKKKQYAGSAIASIGSQPVREMKSKWYTNKWNANWVWWTIGGYFVSSWLFNIADMINQIILPASVFEQAGEGVVAQLISPENNDIWASIVGYIAPCCSAPFWEELLYRGYMLPAMCLSMPFWVAIVISGFVFSAHHMSATGFIPLMVLGMAWATLYAKCGNLMVTILIHAMWNSRVFIGSWLGF